MSVSPIWRLLLLLVLLLVVLLLLPATLVLLPATRPHAGTVGHYALRTNGVAPDKSYVCVLSDVFTER